MRISDLDVTLMMHPALNQIINSALLSHEGLSKKMRINRSKLGSTCLYHTVLDSHFKESSTFQMVGKKPKYPTMHYLGNIEINYLSDHAVWEVKISNGGKKRKNAKLPYKVKEMLYIRRLQGVYVEDKEFSQFKEKKE